MTTLIKTIQCLLLCFLFPAMSSSLFASEIVEQPNIIVILADDLGYGDLGVYGQKQIKTPHLDKMASEGMRFTNFYAGSTVCAPSRCVLMTGRHLGRSHVRGNRKYSPTSDEPLPDTVVTLAEVLKKAGYTTALVGKWGLGGHDNPGAPARQGFDYSFGYLSQRHAHNYYPQFLYRNNERITLPNEVPGSPVDGAGVASKKEVYSHSLFADEALTFIESSKDKRFFLYYSPTLPHANNEGRGSGMEVPDAGIYKDKDWPENERNFAAMVSLLDESVGAILSKLKELGIDRNTIVLFSSDNGPHSEGGHSNEFFESAGPLKGKKRDLYEGGIRVPMIAWWPGKIAAGRVSDHVGYLGDLMSTLAELAVVPPPDDINSISFVRTLLKTNGRQPQHEYLYWEFYEGLPIQAVRLGKWKAIRKPSFTGTVELYDLETDPGETRDISAANPKIVSKAVRAMEKAHSPSPIWNARADRP